MGVDPISGKPTQRCAAAWPSRGRRCAASPWRFSRCKFTFLITNHAPLRMHRSARSKRAGLKSHSGKRRWPPRARRQKKFYSQLVRARAPLLEPLAPRTRFATAASRDSPRSIRASAQAQVSLLGGKEVTVSGLQRPHGRPELRAAWSPRFIGSKPRCADRKRVAARSLGGEKGARLCG